MFLNFSTQQNSRILFTVGNVDWDIGRHSGRYSGRQSESLQPSLSNFHLYFVQTKGNTIGWKMTFRKSKLIDNRPSWHPLRLCVKFGSQGDQIGSENLFQPSMQTGSFDVILDLAKRILRAEDKSDRVCSSCGTTMKILHQLYSFVSSASSPFAGPSRLRRSLARFSRGSLRSPK